MQAVRCLFKHAFDNGLIERPVHFGSTFKKVLRRHRAEQGAKLFTADEIRRLVAGAIQPFKAMLLLAINGGMGNSDVGNLPFSALDLDAGWITYPRPKTGVPRRFALWPETVAAIREAVAARPEPKNPDHAGLVFITLCGDSWSKETAENPVSDLMAKLLHKLEITGRKGLGFYTLRHVFRTVADEAKDPVAADHIMGHEVANMSSVYREGVGDERLQAVADHVHGWLYPTEKKTRQRGKRKATVNPA